jgi:predicted HicB family RNase H-like nuclease
MNNTMSYKGYLARIEFDARDNIFVGHVLGIADRISFHGEAVGELTAEFHHAVDHYLEDCAKTGRAPEKPASGKLMLRIRPRSMQPLLSPQGKRQKFEPVGR